MTNNDPSGEQQRISERPRLCEAAAERRPAERAATRPNVQDSAQARAPAPAPAPLPAQPSDPAGGKPPPRPGEASPRRGRPDAKRSSLLHFRDMPPHLQFNPYIFTGYRPLLTFWGSIRSLFYLHNETINILTHGIPIVYMLVSVPSAIPWHELDSFFLPWCHIVGAICPWVGSFVYHLFMNLEGGEAFYYRLLQLDMFGIWMSQSFGALPMVSASVHCLPWTCRCAILLSYCLLSVWGLYKAMTAWSPWERRLCFSLPFIVRVFLCGLRYTSWGGGDPESFHHVILQDAVSAVGGAIGAMHIPEKWFPGTVDLYLNSHNIMHVLVVTAVYPMHQATVNDLLWMAHAQCRKSDQRVPFFAGLLHKTEL